MKKFRSHENHDGIKGLRQSLLLIAGLVCFASLPVSAQHNAELYNNGTIIYNNSIISVWGDMHQMGNANLTNNGTIQVQGHLYSGATFQQRGTGTVRIQNPNVNIGQMQFIQGSYAVRGGQASIGVNDGSFYNLVLGNDQGIVWLNGSGDVADVRNSVDFQFGAAPVNRIVTSNPLVPGMNASDYIATFGIMNPAAGLGSMLDNTITTNGNVSGVDNGYVQGVLRRAISPTGGQYGFVLGLEPAGATAARGVQYARIDFAANNYDVVYGAFQQGSDNTIPGTTVECGYNINYFGGIDHGEWYFGDLSTLGSGNYQMWVWPQDHNYPAASTWFITKNNAVSGLSNDCGPSFVGLDRNDFNGFGALSEFNVASGTVVFPIELIDLFAHPVNNRYIHVGWLTDMEINSSHFEVERSEDLQNWTRLGNVQAAGTTTDRQGYGFDDHAAVAGIDYHYRLKSVDRDGAFSHTHAVTARLEPFGGTVAFDVWPNPFNDEDLQVMIEVEEAQDVKMDIYDGLGRIVWSAKQSLVVGPNQFSIPADRLADGSYHLRVVGKTVDASKKIVKIKR